MCLQILISSRFQNISKIYLCQLHQKNLLRFKCQKLSSYVTATSSLLSWNLGQIDNNTKIKKHESKEPFVLFFTKSSYISSNIIDKNTRNIYKFIHMPFLYIPYDTLGLCVRCLQNLLQICINYSFSSFLFFPSSLHYQSQTFIAAYKLYILFSHIMSALHTKMLNQFLYFLQFSPIYFVFWKIKQI